MTIGDLYNFVTSYSAKPKFIFFENIAEMHSAVSANMFSDHLQVSVGSDSIFYDPDFIFSKEFLNIEVIEIRAIGLDEYVVAVRQHIGGGD